MKWKHRFSSADLLRILLRVTAYVSSVIDGRDVLFFGGMAATCYGVSLIYPPAAWIIGGIVSCALGLRR